MIQECITLTNGQTLDISTGNYLGKDISDYLVGILQPIGVTCKVSARYAGNMSGPNDLSLTGTYGTTADELVDMYSNNIGKYDKVYCGGGAVQCVLFSKSEI